MGAVLVRFAIPSGHEAPDWSDLPPEQQVTLEEIRLRHAYGLRQTQRRLERVYEEGYCQAAVVRFGYQWRAQPCGADLWPVREGGRYNSSYGKILYQPVRCPQHERPAEQAERYRIEAERAERHRLKRERQRKLRRERRKATAAELTVKRTKATDRRQRLLAQYEHQGMTYKLLAEQEGLSMERIRQIVDRGRRERRTVLNSLFRRITGLWEVTGRPTDIFNPQVDPDDLWRWETGAVAA